MAKLGKVSDAFERLAATEDEFFKSEFLAPVVRGTEVRVRIAGVVCQLKVVPSSFEGWGIFTPADWKKAILVREASLGEIFSYLKLFPRVDLVLLGKVGSQWVGIPAHSSHRRFHIEGIVPIRLLEEGQPFDHVETRFDGSQFWFTQAVGDFVKAVHLRRELFNLVPPGNVSYPGVTPEERTAYELCYWPRYNLSEEAQKDREEGRIKEALQHAGADLLEYLERKDSYTVTYEVDGQRHVSSIRKSDLSVVSAGICLSGQDVKFDLQSLVSVIREGRDGHELVRVGKNR